MSENLNMKKPVWVLCYLIDQDAWWPGEAPHDIRFFPDVHTYCFTSEEAAIAHQKTRINPQSYYIKKTYLQEY